MAVPDANGNRPAFLLETSDKIECLAVCLRCNYTRFVQHLYFLLAIDPITTAAVRP